MFGRYKFINKMDIEEVRRILIGNKIILMCEVLI